MIRSELAGGYDHLSSFRENKLAIPVPFNNMEVSEIIIQSG